MQQIMSILHSNIGVRLKYTLKYELPSCCFNMFFYNCSVFVYSTVAGCKSEINLIVIVIVSLQREQHMRETSTGAR